MKKLAPIVLCGFIFFGSLLIFSGCRSGLRIKGDPFFDSFYEKAELIMTRDEKQIYRRLPDDAAREEFIQDFWKIRDPDTSTEENENKTEFEDRIEYANKWFGNYNPYRGREEATMVDDLRGWSSERGRIYVILGPPDELHYDAREFMMNDRITTRAEGASTEQWVYYRFRLMVLFTKRSNGIWSLSNIDTLLFDSMEAAKLNLVDSNYQIDYNRRFKFSAGYKNDGLLITVPLDRLSFKDQDGQLFTQLKIFINVYLNDNKLETLERTQDVVGSEEELMGQDNTSFLIPYVPEKKGKYLFDIIIQDTMGISFSKYRTVVKKRFNPR